MPVERTAACVAFEVMETSIVAGSLEKEQAGVAESPTKKYRKVDAEVKRWFLEFATLKKKLHGWSMVRSLVARHTNQHFAMAILDAFERRTGNSSGLQHDDA